MESRRCRIESKITMMIMIWFVLLSVLFLLVQQTESFVVPKHLSAASFRQRGTCRKPNHNNNNNYFDRKEQTLVGKLLAGTLAVPKNATAESGVVANGTEIANGNNNKPANGTTTTVVEGIGGQGGRVFDVNALKRNLLQETMCSYKTELFALLNTPRSTEQEIVEKLSALVEGSPVRTTTDSNLLDGSWALAYRSKHSQIQHLRGFSWQQQKKVAALQKPAAPLVKTPAMRRIAGKGSLFQSVHKSFCLEHLQDDEDPYVMERTRYWGGLFGTERRSTVASLTRQSLVLQPVSKVHSFFGGAITRRVTLPPVGQEELQLIYADVDLCIAARPAANTNGGASSTTAVIGYDVFTKNQAWLDAKQSLERKLAFTSAWFADFFARHLARQQQQRRQQHKRGGGKSNPIVREVYANSTRLRVLKLGNTVNEDEEAWDSVADPFIHLSADERQARLKAMSVREIEKAGLQIRSQNRKEWLQQLWNKRHHRRKTAFTIPEEVTLRKPGKQRGFTGPEGAD